MADDFEDFRQIPRSQNHHTVPNQHELELFMMDFQNIEKPKIKFSLQRIPGELIKCKLRCKEAYSGKSGELTLTNYRVVFVPSDFETECPNFSVPYGYIAKISESPSSDKLSGSIKVSCKDTRCFKFKFDSSIK